MSKTIAKKCEKCGGLKAGDLHQFSSCALEVMGRLKTRVIELEARILMMSTIENNLRGGLKQLDDIKYNLEEDIQVLKEEFQYKRMTPIERTEYISKTRENEG